MRGRVPGLGMSTLGVGAKLDVAGGSPGSTVGSFSGAAGAAAAGRLAATAVPLPPTVTAISEAGDGAASTARHALGRLAMVIRSRAFGASGFLLGRQGSAVNHQASDLSQPSLAGTPDWRLHPGEPGWQPMRMWKW